MDYINISVMLTQLSLLSWKASASSANQTRVRFWPANNCCLLSKHFETLLKGALMHKCVALFSDSL